MTNILAIIDSLGIGGAERSTAALLPHLVERGLHVEVAVLHDRAGLRTEVEASNTIVHDLSGPGGRPAWVRRIRALLSERPPDLVHTSLFEADVCGRVASRSAGVPVVSTLATESYGHDHLSSPHLSTAKIRACQALDATTARFATRLHAVSGHVADTMAKHLRYPRDRIDVIYRGRADHDRPHGTEKAALKRSIGVAAGEPMILAIGRQERVKGLDRVLDALPLTVGAIKDLTLVVCGAEGQFSSVLDDQVTRLGLSDHVKFLGVRSDIPELLAISDAFVLTSRREGLPGALIEAMAAGTPAIVSDLPQVREVAGPDLAVLVDGDDRRAVASAIVDVLTNPATASTRAALARQRFLDVFTLDRSADLMCEFYERALRR
jgi:glycosyltransferase involved in cell wall biosynthesis